MVNKVKNNSLFIKASLVFCLFLFSFTVTPQTTSINGVVKSNEENKFLVGANVQIKGTSFRTSTSEDGSYNIENIPSGIYKIKVTYIGYQGISKTVSLKTGEVVTANFSLIKNPSFFNEVVVTASRNLEKLTEAPATISVITRADLSKASTLTYTEALQKIKGVNTYRSGIDNIVLNSRGFTTAFNYRFQVLVDGKKAHLPGAGIADIRGYPVAEEDIDRMEIILGPSSALYGPNAHNGLLHIITKHPRKYPGTTVVVGGGENAILFGRLRHAQTFKKLAYKINIAYFKGRDWIKNDTIGIDNNGKVYFENQDPEVKNFRGDASLHYLLSKDIELVASGGYAIYNSIRTNNTGRLQSIDLSYNFQQLRFNAPHLFIQAYRSESNLGRTHSLENKVAAMIAASNAGSPITEEEAIDRVKLIDKGYRLNYEAQYNTNFKLSAISTLRFITGIQYEDNRPNTEGTFLSEGRININDPFTKKLKIRQTGFYGQLENEIGKNWKFVFAGRYDIHSNYKPQFSPRVGIIFKLPKNGAFRITYNRAFQAPEITQQEILTRAGTIPATSIPIVARGNAHGFTLSNGTVIESLQPEISTTLEVGYKGTLFKKVVLDINVYRSNYRNFISPPIAITNPRTGVAPIKQGNNPIPGFPGEYVLTYLNFGHVNINGLDVAIRYQLNRKIGAWLNYSYIDPVNLEDKTNDITGDGKFDELSFNTPKNKGLIGINFNDFFTKNLNSSLSARFVEKYDFISGNYRATEKGKGAGSFQFKDRGPLGDFISVDLNLSYTMKNNIQLNFSISNLLNSKLREFVGSPEIRRLILAQVKYAFFKKPPKMR